MPEEDADGSEVDESEEVPGVALSTIREPPVVEQPSEQALDLSSPDIASQGSAVLSGVPLAIRMVGSDQFDSSLLAKPLSSHRVPFPNDPTRTYSHSSWTDFNQRRPGEMSR